MSGHFGRRGNYTTVTVKCKYILINASLVIIFSYVSVPAPIIVTLNPTLNFAGTFHNLICIMMLSPLVDVSVTVNTVWTGLAGFTTTNTTQPVVRSTTTSMQPLSAHLGQKLCL